MMQDIVQASARLIASRPECIHARIDFYNAYYQASLASQQEVVMAALGKNDYAASNVAYWQGKLSQLQDHLPCKCSACWPAGRKEAM